MNEMQKNAFWDVINTFHEEGLLPYVMLVGSWAEYAYSFYFSSEFKPNLRTRDVDFLYRNLHNPPQQIDIGKALSEKGFRYSENISSGKASFIKEELLEVEFLTQALGRGEQAVLKIPSLGIKAESLRLLSVSNNYPLLIRINGYDLTVPEPSAYVISKLLINPSRKPAHKKNKDITSVKSLLEHIKLSKRDCDMLKTIYESLSRKQRAVVDVVCSENFIVLGESNR
jgi:hypothetical protein